MEYVVLLEFATLMSSPICSFSRTKIIYASIFIFILQLLPYSLLSHSYEGQ